MEEKQNVLRKVYYTNENEGNTIFNLKMVRAVKKVVDVLPAAFRTSRVHNRAYRAYTYQRKKNTCGRKGQFVVICPDLYWGKLYAFFR